MIFYFLLKPILWTLARINFLLKWLSGYSLFSGKCSEKSNSFQRLECSAHRLKVIYKAIPHSLSEIKLDHFLLSHISYEDPRTCIAKNKHVSLMNIDSKYAIFAVVGDQFNVYDSKHGPFVFSVQGKHCLEIITLPLKFLLPLAEHIKVSNKEGPDVTIMWNPGRCGSTLLSQMMEPIPNLVTMSEPDFITMDLGKREYEEKSGIDLKTDTYLPGKLLLACLIIQCKGLFNTSVVIKPRSMAVTNLKYLKGNHQDFGSLYFETKHMFLYRDPVKNIVSIQSMVGSVPKFITRRFMSMMMKKMFGGLSPDPLTEQNAINDVTESLKRGDDQVMAIVFFILHILCYLKGKGDTNINVHTIKYEDILSNPKDELEKIVCFLNKQKDINDYSSCLEAMNKDSQEKSENISKEKLAAFKKKNPITQELVDKIDRYFIDYGLPPSRNFDSVFS